MEIPRVLQMPGSRNCGQIAVANLTGEELDYIEKLVGHNGGTKTVHLAKVLRKLGLACEDKLVPVHPVHPGLLNNGEFIPTLALAKLSRGTGKRWHWVAVVDGVVLDGQNPTLNWGGEWKITSYLRVTDLRPV